MFLRKNNFGFLLIFILLSMSVVYAEELVPAENTEPVNFLNTPELNLTGSQITYFKTESGAYELKFLGENSSLEVNGIKFDNIEYNAKTPGKITIGSTGEVTYAKFSTNDVGDVYTMGGITFEAPPNSEVFYDRRSGKVTITSTQDSSISNNPSFYYCDNDLSKCSGKEIEFYAEHGTITLPDGNVLESGKIIKGVNDGYSISPASTVVINGVNINAYDKNKVYSLFFNEEGIGESYISFSKEKVSGNMKGGILIDFEENNPYAKIEGGDFLRISGNDGRFELESNSNTGKIPSLNLYGNSRVWNDGKFLEYDHGSKKTLFSREYGAKKIEGKTSTPMEISFFDLDKKPVLDSSKSKTEYKILFDNFDRFAVIPKKSGDEFYSELEGVDTKFSSRLRYNYVDEKELQILTGNKIKFEGGSKKMEDKLSTGRKSLMLGRARDYYNTLTQETKDSVTNIYLTDTDSLIKKSGYSGIYNEIDKSVYVSYDKMNLLEFRHEMAHAREYIMDDRSEFREEWSNIFVNTGSSNLKYKYSKWRDGAVLSEYPKDGLIRPYSLKNDEEHVATYLEPISTNPAFFKDLINPKSSKYDSKYMDSINLLYKYKFISMEEYNDILQEAGLL